jgi:hypothetical protein
MMGRWPNGEKRVNPCRQRLDIHRPQLSGCGCSKSFSRWWIMCHESYRYMGRWQGLTHRGYGPATTAKGGGVSVYISPCCCWSCGAGPGRSCITAYSFLHWHEPISRIEPRGTRRGQSHNSHPFIYTALKISWEVHPPSFYSVYASIQRVVRSNWFHFVTHSDERNPARKLRLDLLASLLFTRRITMGLNAIHLILYLSATFSSL